MERRLTPAPLHFFVSSYFFARIRLFLALCSTSAKPSSSSKAPQIVTTHAAPGTVLRQDYDRNSSAPVNNSKPQKQTVF